MNLSAPLSGPLAAPLCCRRLRNGQCGRQPSRLRRFISDVNNLQQDA